MATGLESCAIVLRSPIVLDGFWQYDWYDPAHLHSLLLNDSYFYILSFIEEDVPVPKLFYHIEGLPPKLLHAKVSLDKQLIAVQTTLSNIVVLDVLNKKRWPIEIKKPGENRVLASGIIWSDHGGNSQDLVIVTTRGLELYKVSTSRGQCKLSRLVSQHVHNFWYEVEHRMVLLASRGSSPPSFSSTSQTSWQHSSLPPGPKSRDIYFMDGYFLNFDTSGMMPALELPPPDKSPRFELGPGIDGHKDITLASLYGKLCCMVHYNDADQDFIIIYHITSSAVTRAHSIALQCVSPLVSISVIDNILVCHLHSVKQTAAFDVKCRGIGADLSSGRDNGSDGFSGGLMRMGKHNNSSSGGKRVVEVVYPVGFPSPVKFLDILQIDDHHDTISMVAAHVTVSPGSAASGAAGSGSGSVSGTAGALAAVGGSRASSPTPIRGIAGVNTSLGGGGSGERGVSMRTPDGFPEPAGTEDPGSCHRGGESLQESCGLQQRRPYFSYTSDGYLDAQCRSEFRIFGGDETIEFVSRSRAPAYTDLFSHAIFCPSSQPEPIAASGTSTAPPTASGLPSTPFTHSSSSSSSLSGTTTECSSESYSNPPTTRKAKYRRLQKPFVTPDAYNLEMYEFISPFWAIDKLRHVIWKLDVCLQGVLPAASLFDPLQSAQFLSRRGQMWRYPSACLPSSSSSSSSSVSSRGRGGGEGVVSPPSRRNSRSGGGSSSSGNNDYSNSSKSSGSGGKASRMAVSMQDPSAIRTAGSPVKANHHLIKQQQLTHQQQQQQLVQESAGQRDEHYLTSKSQMFTAAHCEHHSRTAKRQMLARVLESVLQVQTVGLHWLEDTLRALIRTYAGETQRILIMQRQMELSGSRSSSSSYSTTASELGDMSAGGGKSYAPQLRRKPSFTEGLFDFSRRSSTGSASSSTSAGGVGGGGEYGSVLSQPQKRSSSSGRRSSSGSASGSVGQGGAAQEFELAVFLESVPVELLNSVQPFLGAIKLVGSRLSCKKQLDAVAAAVAANNLQQRMEMFPRSPSVGDEELSTLPVVQHSRSGEHLTARPLPTLPSPPPPSSPLSPMKSLASSSPQSATLPPAPSPGPVSSFAAPSRVANRTPRQPASISSNPALLDPSLTDAALNASVYRPVRLSTRTDREGSLFVTQCEMLSYVWLPIFLSCTRRCILQHPFSQQAHILAPGAAAASAAVSYEIDCEIDNYCWALSMYISLLREQMLPVVPALSILLMTALFHQGKPLQVAQMLTSSGGAAGSRGWGSRAGGAGGVNSTRSASMGGGLGSAMIPDSVDVALTALEMHDSLVSVLAAAQLATEEGSHCGGRGRAGGLGYGDSIPGSSSANLALAALRSCSPSSPKAHSLSSTTSFRRSFRGPSPFADTAKEKMDEKVKFQNEIFDSSRQADVLTPTAAAATRTTAEVGRESCTEQTVGGSRSSSSKGSKQVGAIKSSGRVDSSIEPSISPTAAAAGRARTEPGICLLTPFEHLQLRSAKNGLQAAGLDMLRRLGEEQAVVRWYLSHGLVRDALSLCLSARVEDPDSMDDRRLVWIAQTPQSLTPGCISGVEFFESAILAARKMRLSAAEEAILLAITRRQEGGDRRDKLMGDLNAEEENEASEVNRIRAGAIPHFSFGRIGTNADELDGAGVDMAAATAMKMLSVSPCDSQGKGAVERERGQRSGEAIREGEEAERKDVVMSAITTEELENMHFQVARIRRKQTEILQLRGNLLHSVYRFLREWDPTLLLADKNLGRSRLAAKVHFPADLFEVSAATALKKLFGFP